MNDRSIHCKLSNRRYRALDHVGIDSPEPFTPSVRAFRAHPSIPGSFVVIIGLGLFGLYILQAACVSAVGMIVVLCLIVSPSPGQGRQTHPGNSKQRDSEKDL